VDFYWLVLGILAVWRVTHLFQAEDGPWDLVVRLRRRLGNCFWGQLLDCFYCLSLWIAVPAAWFLGSGWKEQVFLWLAFSGGASLLERVSAERPAMVSAAIYSEDKGVDDVMLRGPEKGVSGHHAGSPPR
jgi:hypothetical protein